MRKLKLLRKKKPVSEFLKEGQRLELKKPVVAIRKDDRVHVQITDVFVKGDADQSHDPIIAVLIPADDALEGSYSLLVGLDFLGGVPMFRLRGQKRWRRGWTLIDFTLIIDKFDRTLVAAPPSPLPGSLLAEIGGDDLRTFLDRMSSGPEPQPPLEIAAKFFPSWDEARCHAVMDVLAFLMVEGLMDTVSRIRRACVYQSSHDEPSRVEVDYWGGKRKGGKTV